ncbi:gypsy/ty3 retroelement polyprotein [Tanacetum coccineum]|uniref:Gypsy/ty3 retroelement polyprotein n=1 Tax=Tanacetum coccineum TaxID=301880 RepID=A0ABQ4X8T8_9ASTR
MIRITRHDMIVTTQAGYYPAVSLLRFSYKVIIVGTRTSSLEVQIYEATRNWVTNYVESVVGPLNERLEGIAASLAQLLVQQQYANRGDRNNKFSRLGKMEFPKFHGEDVNGWMFRVKQFFAIDAVGEADKIKLVSIHLYDRALTWHMQFIKTHGKAVTWVEYEEAVLKRFGDANEDPMAELKNLRYKTTMKQYQSDFEALLNQVNITKAQAISMYIAGLPATIEMNVRMFKPRSLEDAFSLSSLQETTLALVKQRYNPILLTPRTTTNTFVNRNVTLPAKNTSILALPAPISQTVTNSNVVFGSRPRKILSQKEYNEKRSKNQCFYYDQKYIPGHKCEGQMLTIEIRGEDEESSADSGMGENMEFQALLEEYANVFEEPKTLPPHRSFDLKTHSGELLDSGVIRPSHSPFSSLIVMVKKKDEELIDELQGAQVFSKLDLSMGVATDPILAVLIPNFEEEFIIETDASGVGIGAVLQQHGHPVAYLSKTLATKHQSFCYEKELLAVVMDLQKWRGFDYEIEYKKGKDNVVADALSRVERPAELV